MNQERSSESFVQTHIPVMLKEVLASLESEKEGIYVDGTFGGGGYTRGILDAHPKNRVIALDCDPEAQDRSQKLEALYKDRLRFCSGYFRDMELWVEKILGKEAKVQGVCLDLGVSSSQLDRAERGFSFRFEGPLDMRMNPARGPSAAEVLREKDEQELADIFWQLGQERLSRSVARKIVEIRDAMPLQTTTQLAKIIRSVVPKERRSSKGSTSIDPATRVFQALRLYVNAELEELERGLTAAESVLGKEGRLVVVSFHSLEDRLVKRFLQDHSCVRQGVSRYLPEQKTSSKMPTFRLPFRKALRPDRSEIEENPRARSARLRVGIRTDVPIHRKVSRP